MTFPRNAPLSLISVLTAGSIYRQRDLSRILGVVTHSSQAVGAGARIVITECATGQSYNLTTDSNGGLVRPAMKPGTYTVQVEAAGFKKATEDSIILPAGGRTAGSSALQFGDATQSFEIAAEAQGA